MEDNRVWITNEPRWTVHKEYKIKHKSNGYKPYILKIDDSNETISLIPQSEWPKNLSNKLKYTLLLLNDIEINKVIDLIGKGNKVISMYNEQINNIQDLINTKVMKMVLENDEKVDEKE